MRILHTSDWHLGTRLGSQDRLDDQFARLDEIAAYVDEREVDVLLVAGDVFDEYRAEPLARIIRRLAALLRPHIESGLTCVFIAGNHDREHVFPLLSGLQDLVSPGDRTRVVFAERPALAEVTDRAGGERLTLLLLPYPTPTRYDLTDQRWPSPEAKRKDLADAVRTRIAELGREAPAGQPVVLCGHFLLRGVKEGFYQMSEQDDVVLEVSDMPAGYAYVALGHIHKPQSQGATHIRYCGSPERMDRGEQGDRKVALLVDVSKGGLRGQPEELPLHATPFAHVEASSEAELVAHAAALPDIERTLVSVTLTLRRDQSLAALQARARELFPRLYSPPEVRWAEQERPSRRDFSLETSDVAGTVRSYLTHALKDDVQAGELMRLADELVAASQGAPA